MANTNKTINIDGVDLFGDCLSQATLIVKQVMPSHFANATPDPEWDVRDLTSHMIAILESVPATLSGSALEAKDEVSDDADVDAPEDDLSARWQQAADRTEAAISEIDFEDTVLHGEQQITVESLLIELAGDLLIHAWDLGEAIGMPVRFSPSVAEAVMETTVVPNRLMLNSHTLFTESIDPPANADLQARLLALFGRSYAWRTAS
ncbi:TIGR03086 family protein [Polaromonas sp.]|nr:TIGR03086 family protein [Candidatus Saccharibacteria bacterium]